MGMDGLQGDPEGRLRLVVGLGNPGPKYRATRHNIGFAVLDRIAQEFAIDASREKFAADHRCATFQIFFEYLAKTYWSSTMTSTWLSVA
jgi:peptidyl-tRNA hydrolase